MVDRGQLQRLHRGIYVDGHRDLPGQGVLPRSPVQVIALRRSARAV
jgi:hypothetical protein